jgi:flagellar motor switch protein FliM
MSPDDEIPSSPDAVSLTDSDAPVAESAVAAPPAPTAQPYDFRNRLLISPGDLRKLRQHQEGFADALASRLTLLLRLEFTVKLARLQTISYRSFARSWRNPSHLTLFKLDPLKGVCVVEMPPPLASGIVDRLMGGPGQLADPAQEMSEIERALLEQAVVLILGEWCGRWSRTRELKPVVLGYETDGNFVHAAAADASMLVLSLDAQMGECVEQIHIAFPYSTVEPLIQQITRQPEPAPAATPPPAPSRWNAVLDDVCIPVAAHWEGLELAARQVLNLKVGDVLQLDPRCAQEVKVRLGDQVRFNARLGTTGGQWAVELTAKLNG